MRIGRRTREREAEKKSGGRKNTGIKLAAAAAAAVVLTAGTAVHERFRAGELVSGPDRRPPAAAVEQTCAVGEDIVAELPEEERKLSRTDVVRSWFLRLPVWVKSAFLLPLWAVGSLPAALAPVLGPAWNALVSFGVQALVLAALFCLAYKLLCPKGRVRELFRKRNLVLLLAGALTLAAANVLLAQAWSGWPLVRVLLLAGLGFGVLCLLWKRLCGALRAPEPERVRTRLVVDKAA